MQLLQSKNESFDSPIKNTTVWQNDNNTM